MSTPAHIGGPVAIAGRHGLTAHAAAGLAATERLEQGFHLRDLLRIFYKRKWTILIIFTVFAVFSTVRTYMAQPVFRASTTLQIERFTPRVLDYKDVTPGETDYSDSVDFYTTNYELLKSRTVSERAVEDLGMRKPLPADAGREPVHKPVPTSFLEDLFTRMHRGPTPADLDVATRDDNALVGAFQTSITVEPVRRSRLVRLHFDSTDPFFAAKAVNALAQSFISINLERRFEASAYAKTFLEEKLGQTKAKLEDSERELVKFSREMAVFTTDDKQNTSMQAVQEYSSAVSKAEQDRIKAEALYRQAIENPDSIQMVRDNRNILEIKERKGKLESEYQENLRTYKPAFPKMQALKSQIDEVERQLQAEYERIRKASLASYNGARAQESMLKQRLASGKQELLDLQGRSIRHGILKREVDTNRELYNGLLQRLKEVSVAGGVGINNISVVDKAQVPLLPYKPDFGKGVSMGLMIGLIIGLLVAWLLEHFDDSIRFADDVERETGAAVLGVVPKLKPLEPGRTPIALSPHLDPASAFSEAYRSVRTALQFSTASGAPRRLVVTSSAKNEGKSTTALALAINFAQLGKPVLLVDADLRNPVLHKLLQLDNDYGLSNFLSGNVGVMEVIHRTEIPGLFVMTTGPLPPNPVELLASTKLLAMLEQCEEHFAHVVVDGPPVLGIADAIVLANQIENVVFVVESGRTRKGHAKAALKRLYQAGVHPLGVILTKIDAYHDLYGYSSYYQYSKPAIPAKNTAEA